MNGSGPCQVRAWWRRPGRVAGVAVGLLLVERLLVGEVGSPTALVRTLQDLGDPGADPILSTLALMGLLAEALVGYLLLVLAVRPLATLPGLTGRLARRITIALAPAEVRGSWSTCSLAALLVQITVAAPGPSLHHLSSGSCRAWSPRRHGRVRDELLNIEEFTSLTVAQVVIQTWRIEDNTYRPHSALDGLTPAEYAATWTPTTQPALS